MSQTPPPFAPSAPPARKDRTLTVVILIIVGLILFCGCGVAILGYFGWGFMKKATGPIIGCTINFEATRDAVLEYAKDHGGRLPKAATWQDDVRSYVVKNLKRDRDIQNVQNVLDAKVMNPDGDWGCFISETQTTGIAYNSEVAGKLLTEIADPYATVLIFEMEKPAKNAARKYEPLPMMSSPKMFGQPRGWIRYPVTGEMQGIQGNNGSWRVRSGRYGGNEPENPPPTPEPGKEDKF